MFKTGSCVSQQRQTCGLPWVHLQRAWLTACPRVLPCPGCPAEKLNTSQNCPNQRSNPSKYSEAASTSCGYPTHFWRCSLPESHDDFSPGIWVNSAVHSQSGHTTLTHTDLEGRKLPHDGAQGQAAGPSSENEAGATAEGILHLTLTNEATGTSGPGQKLLFDAFLVKVSPGAGDSRSPESKSKTCSK